MRMNIPNLLFSRTVDFYYFRAAAIFCLNCNKRRVSYIHSECHCKHKLPGLKFIYHVCG